MSLIVHKETLKDVRTYDLTHCDGPNPYKQNPSSFSLHSMKLQPNFAHMPSTLEKREPLEVTLEQGTSTSKIKKKI